MLRQLLRKELSLQRSALGFALAVIMVSGMLLIMARHPETELIRRQLTMGLLVSILQGYLVAPSLLLVLPLLIGAAMVAEERRLGVWDWQLSLPAPRPLQWALKIGLGTALTLTLSHLVLPGLDWAMIAMLAGHSDPVPLASQFLAINAGYTYIPLLVMACGTFASSLAADAYKAFFLGALLTGAALLSFHLVDSGWLLLRPWRNVDLAMVKSNHAVPLPSTRNIFIALGAIIVILAYSNFRFEGLRWRRLCLELLAFIILANAAAWLVLRADFGVTGWVSHNPRDVEPIVKGNRKNLELDPPDVPWRGITPLFVKRWPRNPFAKPSREMAFNATSQPIAAIYHLPKSNKAIVELRSIQPPPTREYVSEGVNQILELDVASGALRQMTQLIGYVKWIAPDRPIYMVQHMFGSFYLVNRWPVPLRNDGPLALTLGLTEKANTQEDFDHINPGAQVGLTDGRVVKIKSARPIARTHDLQCYLGDGKNITRSVILVRHSSVGAYELLDEQPAKFINSYNTYAVSTNGKWFARQTDAYRTNAQDNVALSVFSTDHKTTWTVASPEGDLLFSEQLRTPLQALNARPLGSRPDGLLRVSPSGRFMPFVRSRNINLDVRGRLVSTGYYRELDLALLDLQSGREIVLKKADPTREMQDDFKESMKNYLWENWLRNAHGTGSTTATQVAAEANPLDNRFLHHIWLKMPPLAWSPGHDRIAILDDDQIQFYDYLPKAAALMASLKDMGGFVPEGRPIDLNGFGITDFAFWDENTLLAWGELGIFKIDLKAFLYAPEGTAPGLGAELLKSAAK